MNASGIRTKNVNLWNTLVDLCALVREILLTFMDMSNEIDGSCCIE